MKIVPEPGHDGSIVCRELEIQVEVSMKMRCVPKPGHERRIFCKEQDIEEELKIHMRLLTRPSRGLSIRAGREIDERFPIQMRYAPMPSPGSSVVGKKWDVEEELARKMRCVPKHCKVVSIQAGHASAARSSPRLSSLLHGLQILRQIRSVAKEA